MSRRSDAAMIDEIGRDLGTRAGLVFDEGRRPGLVTAIERRIDALGLRAVAQYAALVLADDEPAARERAELLDSVTIQETYFFRNGPQMRALRTQILPTLVRRAAGERRPLRIWSAGCSTGEEPYSIAMLVLDVMDGTGLTVPVEIVGTDLAASAVATARTGVYRGRSLELADYPEGDRWFVPLDDGSSAVHADARALVDIRLHNLVADAPPFDEGTVDLIVCRNVTIYFAKPTTVGVIATFHRTLAPHGHLLLGHAETLWQVSDAFDLLPVGEAFVYRRREAAATMTAPTRRDPAPLAPSSPTTGAAGGGSGSRRARRARSAPTELPVRIVGGAATSGVDTTAGDAATAGPDAPARRTRRNEGNPAAAGAAFSGSSALAPSMAGAADAALREGRYQDAFDLALRAVDEEPLAVHAYAVAGRAAVALGADDRALEPLRKAVYLDPACAEAHFTLAGVLARSGQPAAAAAAYRAAAGAVPTTPADRLLRMLDGRDPASLVELCHRLADEVVGGPPLVGADASSTRSAGGA